MRLAKQSQYIPLQKVVYFITLLLWFVKYSHFTQMMCYYLNVRFQGQRVKECDIILFGSSYSDMRQIPPAC